MANRFGVHVVPEGGPVAIVERLEVDDRHVHRALAFGLDAVIGEALGADTLLVGVPLGGPYHLAEPDALDAGVTIGQLLALDISAPLRPRYLSARGEQAGGTEQNLLMIDQALLDGVGDLADQQFELLLGRSIAVGAQLLENEQLAQQGERQHQPGDTVAPVEQLRQVYAGRFDGGRFAHPTHSALRQDRKSRLSRPGRRSKGTAADLLASVEDLKAAPDANYAWAIIAGHAAH